MMDLFLKSESAMCCPSSATRMKTFLDDNFFFYPEGLAEPEDLHFMASAAALGNDFPLEDVDAQSAEKLIISGLESEVRPARSLSSAASVPTHAARCWEDDDDSETSPASDEDHDTGSSGLQIRRGEAAAASSAARAKAKASGSMPVINAARLTEKDVPSFLQWFSDLGDRPFRLPSTTVADPAATPTPYSDAFSSSQHQRKSQRSPKEGHVKRPVNCFMLFSMMYRRKFLETNPNANNAGLSKLLSRVWRTSVSEAEKDAWRQEYDTLMKFFKMENPTYKYRPKKKKQIATVISSGHHHHHQQQPRVKNQLGLTVDTKASQRLPGPALITPPAVVGDASMTSSPRGAVDVDFYLPLTPDEPSTPPAKIARKQKRPATKSTKGTKAAKVPKTTKNAKKAAATKSAAKRKRERPGGRQTLAEPSPHHPRVQQKQVHHQQQQQQQSAPSSVAEPLPAELQLDYGAACLGRVSQGAGQFRLETTSAPVVVHPLKIPGAELGVKIEPLSPPPESRSPTLQAVWSGECPVWSGECPVVPVLPVPVLLHHHRNPGLTPSGVVPALTPSQLLAACGGSLSETSGQPQLLVPVQHVMESQGEVVFLLDRLCLHRPVGAAPAPAHSVKEEQETEILAEKPAYTGEVSPEQEEERVVRVKEEHIGEEQENDDIADKDPSRFYAANDPQVPGQLSEVPDQLTEEELRHNLPPWFTLSKSASSSEASGVGPGPTVPAALVPAGTTEEVEEEVVMVFTPLPINHVTDFEVEHPGDSLPNEIFDDSMTDDENSSVVCVAGFSFSN